MTVQLDANVVFANSPAGNRTVQIRQNGTPINIVTVPAASGGTEMTRLDVGGIKVRCAVNDSFDVQVTQTSGSPLQVSGAAVTISKVGTN
jgi:hypothetical protein